MWRVVLLVLLATPAAAEVLRPADDAALAAGQVRDADFTAGWVEAHVPELATDPGRLAAMSAAASGLIPRDADEKLARIVLEAGS